MFDNIFPKFSFSNKVWFCPDIFSWFLFGQPLPIFVVLNFFRKKADLKITYCFFILGLRLFWSRVQQNHPDKKSVGDFQSWESNRGQQWLSRTDQINIYQGFIWGRNFDCFSREKIRPFGHTADGAGSLLKKRKYGLFDRPQQVIRKLYGFKKLTEVFTPAEFHFEEIKGRFPFHNTIKHRFYEKF